MKTYLAPAASSAFVYSGSLAAARGLRPALSSGISMVRPPLAADKLPLPKVMLDGRLATHARRM
jgi:hypothetical protein